MAEFRNGQEISSGSVLIDPQIEKDVLTYTDNHTVLQTQSGKELIMNSASNKTFTISAGYNVGTNYTFGNINTGRITIQMSGSETIDDSSAGGTNYSDDDLTNSNTTPSITITKVSSTHWHVAPGANGTWTTT